MLGSGGFVIKCLCQLQPRLLQFRGRARVDNSEETREKVYNAIPEPEQNADREKKGSPVIIDLDV